MPPPNEIHRNVSRPKHDSANSAMPIIRAALGACFCIYGFGVGIEGVAGAALPGTAGVVGGFGVVPVVDVPLFAGGCGFVPPAFVLLPSEPFCFGSGGTGGSVIGPLLLLLLPHSTGSLIALLRPSSGPEIGVWATMFLIVSHENPT